MVQEVTYKGHTYKVGELVHFEWDDCEFHSTYFGIIREIELRKSDFGDGRYDNTYSIEVLYSGRGYKYDLNKDEGNTWILQVSNCSLTPAQEAIEKIYDRITQELIDMRALEETVALMEWSQV